MGRRDRGREAWKRQGGSGQGRVGLSAWLWGAVLAFRTSSYAFLNHLPVSVPPSPCDSIIAAAYCAEHTLQTFTMGSTYLTVDVVGKRFVDVGGDAARA